MSNAKRNNALNEYMRLEKELTKAIWLRRIKLVLCITAVVVWFSSIFLVDSLNNTGVIGVVGSIACTTIWLFCGAMGCLYLLGNKHQVE